MSGRRLFSASADKTIRVWDTQALRCLHVRLPTSLRAHASHQAGARERRVPPPLEGFGPGPARAVPACRNPQTSRAQRESGSEKAGWRA